MTDTPEILAGLLVFSDLSVVGFQRETTSINPHTSSGRRKTKNNTCFERNKTHTITSIRNLFDAIKLVTNEVHKSKKHSIC